MIVHYANQNYIKLSLINQPRDFNLHTIQSVSCIYDKIQFCVLNVNLSYT